MGVQVGLAQFDAMGDLAMVSPEMSWDFAGVGDFDVNEWDSLNTPASFGGCGCGLGAAKPAVGGHKKFPWTAVVAAGVGGVIGVGAVLVVRKLLKKRR